MYSTSEEIKKDFKNVYHLSLFVGLKYLVIDTALNIYISYFNVSYLVIV